MGFHGLTETYVGAGFGHCGGEAACARIQIEGTPSAPAIESLLAEAHIFDVKLLAL